MNGREREDRLAAGVAAALAGCPPAERLQAYHRGTLDPEARDELADHLPRCPRCAAALAHLESVAGESPPAALPPGVEQRTAALVDALQREAAAPSRAWWSGALRVAAVLAFVVALGLGAWQWLGPGGHDDDLGFYRGGEPLDLLEPVGRVTTPPAAMRWELHPGARSYRVVLLDEAMATVWTRLTAEAGGMLDLDAEARDAFVPGSRYTWRVEALDAVGTVIDCSALAHFEVAGETSR
jgi:hypothetical protein